MARRDDAQRLASEDRRLAASAPGELRIARRRWLAMSALAAGAWLGSWLAPRRTALAAAYDEADTSTKSRDEALRVLPLNELTAESRRKVLAVCESPSIYRRLPQKTVDCDPHMYRFLIRNPEVVVGIWQLMGVSNMTAQRTAPYAWKGDDGTGTKCDVELIYGSDDLHIVYGDGYYEGSVLKRQLTGRCVLILQSGYGYDASRRSLVGSRLDVFLQLDNVGADLIARTLAPWVGKVTDANFAESCKFAAKISQTAETNGPGMQRLADKLTSVEPEVRAGFARVSAGVHERVTQRESGQRASGPPAAGLR
ncbi:MAG: hypothetical protein L0211_18235 [Planctomycetaceae bacterium]|nr:hypothetical protein [Planctomycetaceae bacterium]